MQGTTALVDGCSVPSGGVQEHDGPVYLLSPHLSVAEIEPTYLIYPSDVGDQARPHSQQNRLEHDETCSRGFYCGTNWPRAKRILPYKASAPYKREVMSPVGVSDRHKGQLAMPSKLRECVRLKN